jgi:protein-S-isoprenylcysteine O-methyltransferase
MAEVRTLVRDGPYRVVRHPVYAGEILNWLGLGLLFGGGPVLAYAAGLAVLQALRARVEERKLAGVLGAQYAEYRAAAGFLVPRPRGQVKTVPRAVERPFHHK